jgi:GntR family transcriptional regulator
VMFLTVQDADASTAVLGTDRVLALERVRTADGVPIAVIHTWLSAPAFAGLTAESLQDASLHAVLGENFGVQITSGKRQIRAVRGDRDLLQLLQLDASSPVLLLEGTSFDQNGRPVEVFSTWHHPDHVVFDIDIHSEPGRPTVPGNSTLDDSVPISSHSADAIADRARQLGADLLHFADQLSDPRR